LEPRARLDLRHSENELLVGIAGKLGTGFHSLGPCLLQDACGGARFGFVEACYGTEVDLLVEEILEGGSDVVVVVMVVVMVVVVAVVDGTLTVVVIVIM
jgi:hypothetical protein